MQESEAAAASAAVVDANENDEIDCESAAAAATVSAAAGVSTTARLDNLSSFAYVEAASQERDEPPAPAPAPAPSAAPAAAPHARALERLHTPPKASAPALCESAACANCGTVLYEEFDPIAGGLPQWEWLSDLQPLLEGTFDAAAAATADGGCQRDLRSVHLAGASMAARTRLREEQLPLSPYRTVWCHHLRTLFAPNECSVLLSTSCIVCSSNPTANLCVQACSYFVGAQVLACDAGFSALKVGDKLLLFSRLKKIDDVPSRVEVKEDIPWIDCSRNRLVEAQYFSPIEPTLVQCQFSASVDVCPGP